jgi:hypothetical protein
MGFVEARNHTHAAWVMVVKAGGCLDQSELVDEAQRPKLQSNLAASGAPRRGERPMALLFSHR